MILGLLRMGARQAKNAPLVPSLLKKTLQYTLHCSLQTWWYKEPFWRMRKESLFAGSRITILSQFGSLKTRTLDYFYILMLEKNISWNQRCFYSLKTMTLGVLQYFVAGKKYFMKPDIFFKSENNDFRCTSIFCLLKRHFMKPEMFWNLETRKQGY